MRILVLGGTVFLSRAVAQAAVRRGHDVTCACRGISGSVPDGARHVALDRASHGPRQALEGEFDAVVDVAGRPSWVRAAVAAFPDAHWVFVSTINVYADESVPGGTPDSLRLHEPVTTDEDPSTGSEVYGAMKVACEQIVTGGTTSAMVIRPGLIVGPGDSSGRFAYWPSRLADVDLDHREVLAPGGQDDPVQVIDVRDLAEWIVDGAERRRTGTFDGAGHVLTRQVFLEEVALGVGAQPKLVWVPQDFLLEQGVVPWSGPRSIPVWLPLPEYAGLMSHDVAPSFAAGLQTRSLAHTARDTLAWLRQTPDAVVTGMTRDEEERVLRAWADHPPSSATCA